MQVAPLPMLPAPAEGSAATLPWASDCHSLSSTASRLSHLPPLTLSTSTTSFHPPFPTPPAEESAQGLPNPPATAPAHAYTCSTSYSRPYTGYSTHEPQVDQFPRCYSTTSDIRGTLSHSRNNTDESDEYPAEPTKSHLSSTGIYRRESEPACRAGPQAYDPLAFQPRASLPYPSERSDSRPVRRLRRSMHPTSPNGCAASATPSLTDGSTSPSTSRGSFGEATYGHALQPSPQVAVAGEDDPRFHGSTPYAYRVQQLGYPFPDMYGQPSKSFGRHSFSSTRSTTTTQDDLNPHGKRPSMSPSMEEYPQESPHLQSAFANFSFRSSFDDATSNAYPGPPPLSLSMERVSASQQEREHVGISPRNGVYDIDGARQIYIPQHPHPLHQSESRQFHQMYQCPHGSQRTLLPAHDEYEPAKKRRTTTDDSSDGYSPGLSSRREAASALHLEGLPPPPLSGLQFANVQEHSHYPAPPLLTPQPSHPGEGEVYPPAPHTPMSAVSASRFGSYPYASFASPSYLQHAAPLPSVDSPAYSPRHADRPPLSTPDDSHHHEHCCPPPSAHSWSQGRQHQHQHSYQPPSYGPPSAHSDYLPVPPSSLPYPATPSQVPASAVPAEPPAAAFDDPAYPTKETSPFAICQRRPPQSDFENPPLGGQPYEQKLRFEEDQYTPKYVRFEKKDKEGWCALCPGDGKWLQLKNSAYWYHRQFIHGVSSSSGHYFLPPLELRTENEFGRVSGLCHSCAEWHTYHPTQKGATVNSTACGVKTSVKDDRPPSQWFHHAHKCHTYFSPRKEARKKAKLGV
ncbi:hypothetical protein JCM11641_003875 [Rhodosporidiobolus odoratus]